MLAFAAETLARSEPLKLLAFGDSLTAGYGLPQSQGFAAQLEARLRAAGITVTVINAGVSGDTTAGGRARLDWTLADPPDAVILELGANDGLRGIEPRVSRDNLDAILTRLRSRNIPVLFAGMYAPPNLGKEYGTEFRNVYEDLATRHDIDFYPFFLDGVAGLPDLNLNDGIHPNAAGIAVIVERILPAVQRMLARIN